MQPDPIKEMRHSASRLLTYLFLSLCFLASGYGYADHEIEPVPSFELHPKVKLTPELESVNALPYLAFYIDGSFDAGIQEITKLPSEKWKKHRYETQNFGQTSAPIWFYLKLDQTHLNNEKQYFLKLDYPHHDELDIFFLDHGAVIKEIATGDHRNFDSREHKLPTFVFDIPSQRKELEIYIRLKSEGILHLPLTVISQAELTKQNISFSLLTGIYFGAILIMLFYNSFIYATVKDKSYLYYLAYLLSCAVIQLVLSGLAFQYIWPSLPKLNLYAVILSAAFTGITAITFIKNFIGIDYISSKRDDIFIKMLILFFALTSASSFVLSYSFALKSTFIAVSFMVLTGFYLGVKYWLKGITTARYFALAWFSYLTAVIIFLLENNQFIEPNIFNKNALAIGTLVELTLLSIAFADRLNYEKNLRVEAQDALLETQIEMNQNLDRIVKSRTEELQEANTQLKELSVTDSLTKLRNRYYFDRAFKKEIHRAARDNTSLSVIMIDIDHFKKINDEYGHLYGDFCLANSAKLIMSVVNRPSDTVARYGGEEIAVLLPNTPLDGAMRISDRIREQFRETEFSDSGIDTYLTVSIGVSSASPTKATLSKSIKLLDIADQCLYKAKQNGRDQVVGKKCHFDSAAA